MSVPPYRITPPFNGHITHPSGATWHQPSSPSPTLRCRARWSHARSERSPPRPSTGSSCWPPLRPHVTARARRSVESSVSGSREASPGASREPNRAGEPAAEPEGEREQQSEQRSEQTTSGARESGYAAQRVRAGHALQYARPLSTPHPMMRTAWPPSCTPPSSRKTPLA
jgi:hypothetical protein